MNIFPDDILHLIARIDMNIYCGMLAYPRFARLITNGIRFDYAERFGIDCRVIDGIIHWTLGGELHRADGPAMDGPAHESVPGGPYIACAAYFIRGQKHRVDGPAIVRNDGLGPNEWWQNGYLHRMYGPAILYPNGEFMYLQYGKFHRTDGPSSIVQGTYHFRQNDLLHNTDGPAIHTDNEYIAYYQHGKHHRVDGPAAIHADFQDYYIYDEQMNKKEFDDYIVLHGVPETQPHPILDTIVGKRRAPFTRGSKFLPSDTFIM